MSEIELYSSLDPHAVIMSIPVQKCMYRDENTGNISLGSLSVLHLTNGDVVKILKKVAEIVSRTEMGLSYTIDKLFGDGKKKYYAPPPGTLRVFGNGLASFYDGNGWRKVNLNKGGKS